MLQDQKTVEAQYTTADRLNRRISIHEKYSVNRQGFGPWIASHYDFHPGQRILELGCGTGDMWRGQLDSLPQGCTLLLTDASEGMLQAAKENLGTRENVCFRQMDIQHIQAEQAAFDRVIANMMLYHVPDLTLALGEVRRVLKPDGLFCCATYGENGITAHLSRLLGRPVSRENHRFTLQNGRGLLERFFSQVERLDYPDALAVTDVEDLADYLESLSGMADWTDQDRPSVCAALRQHMQNGVLLVPKEYGLFICRP